MILFLSFAPFSYGGGAERWMIDVAKHLAQNEEVKLMHLHASIANIYARAVLKRNFANRWKHDVAQGEGESLSVITWQAFVPFTKQWRQVREQLRAAKVIYTKFEVNELLLMWYFGGQRCWAKTIVGLHSPLIYQHPHLTFFEKLHNTLYGSVISRYVLQFFNKVHVLTAQQLADLRRISPEATGVLVPNYSMFKPVKPKATDPSTLRVVFLGEFSWRKGSDIVLECAAQRPAFLQIESIGDGSVQTTTPDHKTGLTMHGYLSKDEIAGILATSDVLFLPSRAESFPLALLEALSFGMVLVTSEHAAPTELRGYGEVSAHNTAQEYLKIFEEIWNQKVKGTLLQRRQEIWKHAKTSYSREHILQSLAQKLFS